MDTLFDLNGTWEVGGAPGPIISVASSSTGNTITVDMSAYNRPPASGTILDNHDIKVNFPDDTEYKGELELPGTIIWSNGALWTKDMSAIATIFDLNGIWENNNDPGPVIKMNGNAISIDMSAYNRPTATGHVVSANQITVTFPDDKPYTGVLQLPGTILWANGASWTHAPSSFSTVIDLRGRWASGDVAGPFITVLKNDLTVDMSAYSHPNAKGTILSVDEISVNFPGDGIYRGTLKSAPDRIMWSNSSVWTRTPVPKAPTGLAATQGRVGGGRSEIYLTWTDNSDNEDGFDVLYSYTPLAQPIIKQVAANSTTYTLNVVNDGTKYTIYVYAFNNTSGNSGNSNTVEITVPQPDSQ